MCLITICSEHSNYNSGAVVAWSYGSWIYNYLCNQCLSPLVLWIWISIVARCTTLCDKVCQWLVTGQWFSPGPPVSSTIKTNCHHIAEIKHHQTNKQLHVHFISLLQTYFGWLNMRIIYYYFRTCIHCTYILTLPIWRLYV